MSDNVDAPKQEISVKSERPLTAKLKQRIMILSAENTDGQHTNDIRNLSLLTQDLDEFSNSNAPNVEVALNSYFEHRGAIVKSRIEKFQENPAKALGYVDSISSPDQVDSDITLTTIQPGIDKQHLDKINRIHLGSTSQPLPDKLMELANYQDDKINVVSGPKSQLGMSVDGHYAYIPKSTYTEAVLAFAT